MEVTQDEYELPIVVEDKVKYLSEMSGVSEKSINPILCRQRKGKEESKRWREVEYNFDIDKLKVIVNRIGVCYLAKKITIAEDTIRRWLNGKTEPDFEQLDDLCLFLGVDEDYFIKE